MKKIVLLFCIILFLACCSVFRFEEPSDLSDIERTHEGVIVNLDEGFLGSIKGLGIAWEKPAMAGPANASNYWFIYSGTQKDFEKLSQLKGHRVKIIYVYENDDYTTNSQGRRIVVPIVRLVSITDLVTEKMDREKSRSYF